MEDDDLEMQLLLSGPANEADMYELLGDAFGTTTTLLRNADGESAVQEIALDKEIEDDFLEPSMLGCFLAPWTCGSRGSRVGSNRSWSVEVGRLFGSQYPCTSGARKHRRRKNNDHWTHDEIIELVDGVSKEGPGKWSKVKGKYFSTSIRTPTHLKDKWRNLVRACEAKKNSKKKVNVHKTTELIVRRFKHRILDIEAGKSWQEKEMNQDH